MMSFDEVILSLNKKKRKINLLLGNGFSMSYDPKIFSYNALYDFITSLGDEKLAALLSEIKTKNFELIMQQLDTSLALLNALGADEKLKDAIREINEKLKRGLIDAIQGLHPEHVFKIGDDRCISCAKFLIKFLASEGQIYTTNYDLLLYWVLMRQDIRGAIDGFGRELLNPVEVSHGEEQEWSELEWGANRKEQSIFYLHGTLPLFDTGTAIIKEQYSAEGYLLENIKRRIQNKEYPIFVTAGNGSEKLAHIRHNNYLSDCYDNLSKIDGSVVTFGFGFGKYDEHIIDALNKATHFSNKTPPKLWSIYVGVFSDDDAKYIESIQSKFHAKLYIYDAKTVNLWETK